MENLTLKPLYIIHFKANKQRIYSIVVAIHYKQKYFKDFNQQQQQQHKKPTSL